MHAYLRLMPLIQLLGGKPMDFCAWSTHLDMLRVRDSSDDSPLLDAVAGLAQ